METPGTYRRSLPRAGEVRDLFEKKSARQKSRSNTSRSFAFKYLQGQETCLETLKRGRQDRSVGRTGEARSLVWKQADRSLAKNGEFKDFFLLLAFLV